MANFDATLSSFGSKLNAMQGEYNALVSAYNEARDFTEKFLKCCSKHRVKVVAIQSQTDLIKESKTFPFGVGGSVFAEGESDGWPVIWRICEEYGVSGACGNHNQHSLNQTGKAKLIDGVYRFENGKWEKID